MTSHTFVSYFISSSGDGCCNAVLLDAICPLKSTGTAYSNFGPLIPVYLLVFCTCHKGFSFQNSIYISLIGIFVESVGLNWSFHGTLYDRGSSVPRGPCFYCNVSFWCFPCRFSWCFIFSLQLFGAQDPFFFPNNFPSMPGVSVIFGE